MGAGVRIWDPWSAYCPALLPIPWGTIPLGSLKTLLGHCFRLSLMEEDEEELEVQKRLE